MKRILSILIVVSMLAVLVGCSIKSTESADSKNKNRIAGNVAYFDENKHLNCEKKILTFSNGLITSIDEYKEDLDDVVYLSDNLVIYPGLIDLHSHSEANMYQLFTDVVKEDEMWDNRYEWKNCPSYNDCYRVPNKVINGEWNDPLGAEADSLTTGEMVYLYSELQAAAGGTILLQEDSNNSRQNYLDCHKAIRLIRSTADSDDLLTDNSRAIASYVQIYVPDGAIDRDNPSTYVPYQSTDNWQIKDQVSEDGNYTCLEDIINQIKDGNAAQGYLIHLAEGRAGNLKSDIGPDEYSKKEFEKFKSEIETYVENGTVTRQQIVDANITLIHGCSIDLSDTENYDFIKKFGIGLVWSPVSNLLLYGDTPAFYDYLDDDSINVVIGSDWSPSGSKTVWDECKFALEFINSRKDVDLQSLKEQLLKAATIEAAEAVGLNKIGNIEVSNCADFIIIDTASAESIDANRALDFFFSTGEEDISAVYVGGKIIYAGENYINSYLSMDKYEWCSTDDNTDNLIEPKYYNLAGICAPKTFSSNLQSFISLIRDTYGSVSSLKNYEGL